MDLLLTGATGFIGSHLVLRWLRRHPSARIGCLVRAADTAGARTRLHAALSQAAANEGACLGDLPPGVTAIPGDLDNPAWTGLARAWLRGPAELIHGAARLSFREADREAVLRTNVGGTASLLRALPSLPGIAGFDYISTAYVAGDRQGEILEAERERPPRFNNPYEESKWLAEGLVRLGCAAAGLPWRIMRPSIVIAHSATHRMSSRSGFYQVVDTLVALGRLPRMQGGGPIPLPVARGTALDLIPVDAVVDEVVGLVGAGAASAGQTFHIAAADPLPLAEVLRALTPMSGVAIEVNGADAPGSAATRLVMRGLRHYLPYFAFARRFDRRGAQAALGGAPFRLGLDQLRSIVRADLAERLGSVRS